MKEIIKFATLKIDEVNENAVVLTAEEVAKRKAETEKVMKRMTQFDED